MSANAGTPTVTEPPLPQALGTDGLPPIPPTPEAAETPNQATVVLATAAPPPPVKFNPLTLINYADFALGVDHFNLSKGGEDISTMEGFSAQQSFNKITTDSLKAGMVLAWPAFKSDQKQSWDSMEDPPVYFAVTKYKSPLQNSVFISKLKLAAAPLGREESALLDAKLPDTMNLFQLTVSNVITVLVVSGHLLDNLKAALSPNSFPAGLTPTSVGPKTADDEPHKHQFTSASDKNKKAKAVIIDLFQRPSPYATTSDHLTRQFGATHDLASTFSFSHLVNAVEGNLYASESLAVLNPQNSSLFKEYAWASIEPSFDAAGKASHLHPILLRGPKSSFIKRSLLDVNQDVSSLLCLSQAIMGVHPRDRTSETIFASVVDLINNEKTLGKVAASVIDNELAKTLSALSISLVNSETATLTRPALIAFAAKIVTDNFSLENIVRENSLLAGNPSLDRSKIFSYPVIGSSLLGKRGEPAGGGKNQNPTAPKVTSNQQNKQSKPKLPCHSIKAIELKVKGAPTECAFEARGEDCPFDHTALPPAGTMSTADKAAFCTLIKKAKTKYADKIIDAIATY